MKTKFNVRGFSLFFLHQGGASIGMRTVVDVDWAFEKTRQRTRQIEKSIQ